jgi:serine/threonine protein kinase/Flp pilus assembly protein TadD
MGEASTETTMIGRTLGRYRVVERLGEGGMGAVYRAWDERLERDVALKVISPRILSHADARRRLREEARLLSQLEHPSIATVYDFDAQDGLDFLVMELVRGQTMAQLVARGPVTERDAVAYALQVCEALEAAHERGVIHRDLKPANIMVTARGRVKVLDFGLATCCGSDDEDSLSRALTKPVVPEGTLAYMSPEQLLDHPVDERTDVFSLGAVLFELLAGRPPFRGSVVPAITDAILHAPAPLLSLERPGLSPALDTVIRQCLEKRAEDRYTDARSLAADLQHVATGEAIPIRPRGGSLTGRTHDPEAHRAYLRGRRQWSKRTREGLRKAIEHFESAIDLDPEHAPSWSGLADCYIILAPWLPPGLGYQKAMAAARRALELDPESAEAHTSLAFTRLLLEWDWAGSEAGFKRALELDPTYATGHQWYAELLTVLGRFDEALSEARAAEDLDALSYVMPTTLVNVFYYARRYSEALEHHFRMQALSPLDGYLAGIADRARILEQSGRATEAVPEYRSVIEREDDPRVRAGLACALALSGDPGGARAELAKLAELPADRFVPPYAVAGPLALLGDFDGAFAKLEEALATHDRAMVYVRVNPRFDTLRGDPRYASIVERMGFPS